MAEYWLISAPGQGEEAGKSRHVFNSLKNKFQAEGSNAGVYLFPIPDELKIGTLDSLIALTDDLNKIDLFVEAVVFKLAQYLQELNGQASPKPGESQRNAADLLQVDETTMHHYLTNFRWNDAKYSAKLSIKQISEEISKAVSAIEAEMKAKNSAYSKAKGSIQAIERKAVGSLLVRSLDEMVNPRNFVRNSETLVTLLVVVPRFSFPEWEATYDKLTDFVVPESSELIQEDPEYGLFTVTLFARIADQFKQKAREKRFIVRDFTYDESAVAQAKKEKQELTADFSEKRSKLLQWSQASFSEAFSCWVHLKALRVFVESVLRYGLPVNFMSAVIEPKRASKRVRSILDDQYSFLAGSSKDKAETIEIPGITTGVDYHAYVSFTIDLQRLLVANA